MPPMTPLAPALADTRPAVPSGVDLASVQFRHFYGVLRRPVAALRDANLFRASQAGDKVFQDIERILSAREPAQRNLARLYLYALALGFQGRYHGGGSLDHVLELRRELYQFIYQKPADLQGRDK